MSAFSNPVRLEFTRDAAATVKAALGARRALLVTTKGMLSRAERSGLAQIQKACGDLIVGVSSDVQSNPELDQILKSTEALRALEFDVILAIGGGSVLDSAKAIAGELGHQAGWLGRHLRDGEKAAADFSPKPILALPSTSGTGSEVTMWATVWDHGKKYSIAHRLLYPEVSILDPRLTVELPPEVTAYSALDALSHAMEAIWNKSNHPTADALACSAISDIFQNLELLMHDLGNLDLRAKIQAAATHAGMASSVTKTAIAHSISYPLTGQLGVPHGFACSLTLPELLLKNGEAHPARANLIVQALGQSDLKSAVEALYAWFTRLGVQTFVKRYLDSPAIVEKMTAQFIAPGRAENNLVLMNEMDARAVLLRSLKRIFTA